VLAVQEDAKHAKHEKHEKHERKIAGERAVMAFAPTWTLTTHRIDVESGESPTTF
jgi:hypothetical protein